MSLQVTIPALRKIDKTAIILVATVLFFIFNILDIEDLELIPWNIVLLFSGAMSIGFCLWQTGAAEWMAVNWLAMFKNAHWLVFVVSVAFFVMILTNFIMNVAAIAIAMPVALVISKYLGVDPNGGNVRLPRDRRYALHAVGGGCAKRNRLRFKTVYQRRIFKYGCLASVILMAVSLWPAT